MTSPAAQGRIIRQEQEGMLLIIDQKKLSGKGRTDAIKVLQEAVGRLSDPREYPDGPTPGRTPP